MIDEQFNHSGVVGGGGGCTLPLAGQSDAAAATRAAAGQFASSAAEWSKVVGNQNGSNRIRLDRRVGLFVRVGQVSLLRLPGYDASGGQSDGQLDQERSAGWLAGAFESKKRAN